MDPVTIGLGAFGVVLILLAARVPIAFALGGTATLATFLVYATRMGGFAPDRAIRPTTSVVMSNFFDLIHSYELSMIPLFIALGNIAFVAGITTRIYHAANVWLRRVPGGVAIASVVGCGGFSAISGSSIACASTMGRICVPEMLALRYDRRLATASVAVGGTLGSLIPPSVLFILYGIFTETSIARLFMAGVLPGLVTLLGYCLVIWLWVARDPAAAPAASGAVSTADRIAAAWASWPAAVILVIVAGGIYGGFFTATEAAAVSVIATIAIGLGQRRLTLRSTWDAIRSTVVQSAAIFLIAASAKIFVAFVALTGVAGQVVAWVDAMHLGLVGLMIAVSLIYIVLGMFLDPIGIIVLTLPFLVPMVEAQGMDLIWFGVIVVKLLEIGLITPPVGLNVFVIANVVRGQVGIEQIFAGVSRFLVMDLAVLGLLIAVPALSLWLPAML